MLNFGPSQEQKNDLKFKSSRFAHHTCVIASSPVQKNSPPFFIPNVTPSVTHTRSCLAVYKGRTLLVAIIHNGRPQPGPDRGVGRP